MSEKIVLRHIKIYADGADLESMVALANRPDIAGFTTNPTLMRKAGISDYEAFARKVAPEGAEIWSAGTEPSKVHPLAIEVMKEIGVDMSGHQSKRLDDVPWREMDTVVSLCAEAETACPAVRAEVRRVHWPLDDPSAAPEAGALKAFRDTRDELRWRVACLWPGNE